MFTLKIARTGSAEGSCSWLADIVTVHLIDVGSKTEALERWKSYREDRANLVDHTSFLPSDRDVALLSVVFADGHDLYVTCGRAWLLNSEGRTIERISP